MLVKMAGDPAVGRYVTHSGPLSHAMLHATPAVLHVNATRAGIRGDRSFRHFRIWHSGGGELIRTDMGTDGHIQGRSEKIMSIRM
jgi:hypothetical protein